jgi:hypothetical protein
MIVAIFAQKTPKKCTNYHKIRTLSRRSCLLQQEASISTRCVASAGFSCGTISHKHNKASRQAKAVTVNKMT